MKRIDFVVVESSSRPGDLSLRVLTPPEPGRSPDTNLRRMLRQEDFKVGDKVTLIPTPESK